MRVLRQHGPFLSLIPSASSDRNPNQVIRLDFCFSGYGANFFGAILTQLAQVSRRTKRDA